VKVSVTKITKKPKRVTVSFKEVVRYIPEYTCPSCHVHYVGAGVSRSVTRFRCECGQELIVNVTETPPKEPTTRTLGH